MQIQRRQFGEFRTRSTSLGYSLASRNRSFRYFRVSERPNGTFSTIRSKYLNASSISPRDWLATSRRARGRTNGCWQDEVRNLVSGDVLSTVQTYGDLAFYKLQVERLDLDDPAALENAIKESSAKELRRLIERITFCTLVAVMRQSGTQALVKVTDAIGISSSRPRFNNLGYFLTGLAASGMLFSICILTIALVFALLADPIARLFGKPLDQSLWPNDLDNVGSELWTIVPPIFVCLMMA